MNLPLDFQLQVGGGWCSLQLVKGSALPVLPERSKQYKICFMERRINVLVRQ